MQADRQTRRGQSKEQIMSTLPNFRDTDNRKKRYKPYKENSRIYYIVCNDYKVERKQEILERISNALCAGLKVSVVE